MQALAHYQAFISYAHEDEAIAQTLRAAIHKHTIPWYRRFLRRHPERFGGVFLDQAEIRAGALWPQIEHALEHSEHLILLGSPDAAQSDWVRQELDWWLTHARKSKLLFAVARGRASWHSTASDFDWNATDALPRRLSGELAEEPFIPRAEGGQEKNSPAVLSLASTMLGTTPEYLLDRDRRLRLAIYALVVVVIIVLGGALFSAVRSADQQREARLELEQANGTLAEVQKNLAAAVRETGAAKQRKDEAVKLMEGAVKAKEEAEKGFQEARESEKEAEARRDEALRVAGAAIDEQERAIEAKNSAQELAKQADLDRLAARESEHELRQRELAIKARLLLREPGQEPEALETAIAAVAGGAEELSTLDLERLKPVPMEVVGALLQAVLAAGRTRVLEDIRNAIFSPDGKWILASDGFAASLLDFASGARTRWSERSTNDDMVRIMRFSRDSRYILIGRNDGKVRVWPAPREQPPQAPSQPLAVLQLAADGAEFSPDGERVLLRHFGKPTLVWTFSTGQVLALDHGGNRVLAASFSLDGRQIVTGCESGDALVWDASSGELVSFLPSPRRVSEVQFLSGGLVLTGSEDGSVIVWRPQIGEGRRILTISAHREALTAASASEVSGRILTASSDGTAAVWNAETGELIHRLRGHSGPIVSAVFSPNGRIVATTGRDQTVRLWDAEDGALLEAHTGFSEADFQASFSPDGRSLLATGRTGVILWGAPAQHPIIDIKAHGQLISSHVWSSDSQTIATSSWDRTAKVWRVPGGALAGPVLIGHRDGLTGVDLAPGGERVLTASWDGTAKLWDRATGKSLVTISGHGVMRSARFSPDGRQMVTVSDDGLVRVRGVDATGEASVLMRPPEHGAASAIAFLSHQLLVSSKRGWIEQWTPDLALEDSISTENEVPIVDMRSSLDGNRVLTSAANRALCQWSQIDRRLRMSQIHDSAGVSVLSGDGSRILVASRDSGYATIYSATSSAIIGSLSGFSGRVASAAFSGDTRWLVIGTEKGAVTLWDTAAQREVVALAPHGGAVETVSFSPDGRYLATSGADGVLRAYPMTVAALFREACTLLTRDDRGYGAPSLAIRTGACRRALKVAP